MGSFRDCVDAPKKASAPMKFKLTKRYQYVLTMPINDTQHSGFTSHVWSPVPDIRCHKRQSLCYYFPTTKQLFTIYFFLYYSNTISPLIDHELWNVLLLHFIIIIISSSSSIMG